MTSSELINKATLLKYASENAEIDRRAILAGRREGNHAEALAASNAAFQSFQAAASEAVQMRLAEIRQRLGK